MSRPSQGRELSSYRSGVRPHDLDGMDQVDDQLELVPALEVGGLGLIAGFDERLDPCLDPVADPAAQHRLLTEEVRLGLLGERRLQHGGAGQSEGASVRDAQLQRLPGNLLDYDRTRHAVALLVHAARCVPGTWAPPAGSTPCGG